jgi:hypothetical protein
VRRTLTEIASRSYYNLNVSGAEEAWGLDLSHSYDRTVLPAPFVLGSTTTESQRAGGNITVYSTGDIGYGYSYNVRVPPPATTCRAAC